LITTLLAKRPLRHTRRCGASKGRPRPGTEGELETEISNDIIRFKREYMGRGPQEVRTLLIEDMAIVRLRGVLTPAEQRFAQVEEPHRSHNLIKQVRLELIEHGRELLEVAVQAVLGVRVVSLHTDISTRTGESVILFTLSDDPLGKARPVA
jgi:uncharacterized protein YbcI